MDIILVCPRNPELDKVSLDSVYSSGLKMVPLGLFYIATVLENHGFEVEIVDFNTARDLEECDVFIKNIVQEKPKIIGISVSTTTYPGGKAIAKKLREYLGDEVVFVWGGLHVTFLPEEPLQEGLAGIIVRGEGEYVMLEIARTVIEKKFEFDNIEGISYLKDGSLIHNKPALLRIKDLDSLPIPKRSFIDSIHYKNPGTIISTRGCIAKCQFCAAGAFGSIAVRGVDSVVEEIRILYHDYGIHHICFIDNTFTTHKKRALEILQKVKAEGMNPRYSIESRTSQVDEEFLQRLRENGVFAIHFGVETGSERVLGEIQKHITLEQVRSAVDMGLKIGFEVACSFIIGHPTDTMETVQTTINFARGLTRRGVTCFFAPLTPYPGTEVFNRREELGITILD